MTPYAGLMSGSRGRLLVPTAGAAVGGYIAMVHLMGTSVWMYALALAMFLPLALIHHLNAEAER